MEAPIGGERVSAVRAVGPVQRREATPGLGDDGHEGGHVVQGELRLARDVHGALGDHHVGPEVAVGTGAPAGVEEVEEALASAQCTPPAQARVGDGCVRDVLDPGDGEPAGGGEAAPRPGARTHGGPPATLESGRCDQAEDGGVVLVEQTDEGRPDRDAAYEVVGAVDRVDDPASWAAPGRPLLLADDGVARSRPSELTADELLRSAVGVGDESQVGLGLDDEVLSEEPGHRRALHRVREHMGEAEIVIEGHGGNVPAPGSRMAEAVCPLRCEVRHPRSSASAATGEDCPAGVADAAGSRTGT